MMTSIFKNWDNATQSEKRVAWALLVAKVVLYSTTAVIVVKMFT